MTHIRRIYCMIENIKDRYAFVTNNEDETQCIGIKGGTFEGVIYKYGKVSIPDPDELNKKSDLPLSFHYDIVDNNSIPKEWFAEEFNTLAGDILVDILEEQMKEGTVQFANTDSED